MTHKHFIAIGLGWCLLAPLTSAQAVDRGTTPTGIAYVSGGVGQSELVTLNEEKKNYSFWLTTAAKGSGSYLASVQVRILDARSRQSVLETTMEGPWLFAALPTGRYEVEATLAADGDHSAQTLKKSTTIHPGDRHQMILYFDTHDQVGSRDDTPFQANPYTGK
jgi:hypothetical protein